MQGQSVGRAICFRSPQKELLLCLFLAPGISWRIIGIPQLIRDPRHPHLHGPTSSSLLTSCITSLPYKGTRCVGEGPPVGPHLNPICLPWSCSQSRFPSEVLGAGTSTPLCVIRFNSEKMFSNEHVRINDSQNCHLLGLGCGHDRQWAEKRALSSAGSTVCACGRFQFQFSQSLVSDSLLPMDCSTLGFPVHHQLQELTQTHVSDTIQPFHPLPSPSPPTFNLSQHQGLFQWVSFSHQVAKVLDFCLQHQPFQWIFSIDYL